MIKLAIPTIELKEKAWQGGVYEAINDNSTISL